VAEAAAPSAKKKDGTTKILQMLTTLRREFHGELGALKERLAALEQARARSEEDSRKFQEVGKMLQEDNNLLVREVKELKEMVQKMGKSMSSQASSQTRSYASIVARQVCWYRQVQLCCQNQAQSTVGYGSGPAIPAEYKHKGPGQSETLSCTSNPRLERY
jgi:hypothetical protein